MRQNPSLSVAVYLLQLTNVDIIQNDRLCLMVKCCEHEDMDAEDVCLSRKWLGFGARLQLLEGSAYMLANGMSDKNVAV